MINKKCREGYISNNMLYCLTKLLQNYSDKSLMSTVNNLISLIFLITLTDNNTLIFPIQHVTELTQDRILVSQNISDESNLCLVYRGSFCGSLIDL